MLSNARYMCTGAGHIRHDRFSFRWRVDRTLATPQLQKSQEYELGNIVSEPKASWKSSVEDRPSGVQGL